MPRTYCIPGLALWYPMSWSTSSTRTSSTTKIINTLYDYIDPRKASLVIRNLYFGFGVCIPQVANNTLQWALTAHRL
jgi:hypothetical protein